MNRLAPALLALLLLAGCRSATAPVAAPDAVLEDRAASHSLGSIKKLWAETRDGELVVSAHLQGHLPPDWNYQALVDVDQDSHYDFLINGPTSYSPTTGGTPEPWGIIDLNYVFDRWVGETSHRERGNHVSFAVPLSLLGDDDGAVDVAFFSASGGWDFEWLEYASTTGRLHTPPKGRLPA